MVSYNITVGSRESPLAKAQVQEVLEEIRKIHPSINFEPIYIKTIGDKDKLTSLRTLSKTDFFTKEIDEMQLKGICRISVHSAKDLPEPLPKGLKLIALTKGVDASDSLVFRDSDSLETLPARSLIATSSERREIAVKQLRSDFRFTDIRGTIEERLQKLTSKAVDGVVIAEAALIRLKLTHLNRMTLPGETFPGQGQLAILAREDDLEMINLFKIYE